MAAKANITLRESGFTLLEVLLALSIFTIIGIATVRHITQIQNTKSSSAEELEAYSALRAVISIMRYDLSQAFHILHADLGEENRRALQANQPVPHTLFDGRKQELIFTSLSHRVYYQNLRECEQTEISYFLQTAEDKEAPSLMKRESPIIDSDLYQGGGVYTLLDGVHSLQFMYWNPKTGKWEEDWNSETGEFKDKFPMAVKMLVSVLRDGKPNLDVETEFKISFPNNERYLLEF